MLGELGMAQIYSNLPCTKWHGFVICTMLKMSKDWRSIARTKFNLQMWPAPMCRRFTLQPVWLHWVFNVDHSANKHSKKKCSSKYPFRVWTKNYSDNQSDWMFSSCSCLMFQAIFRLFRAPWWSAWGQSPSPNGNLVTEVWRRCPSGRQGLRVAFAADWDRRLWVNKEMWNSCG